ncbi:outer membrane protein assembly factor BamE [Roseomonas eburnea]|uniref:Outer membrane protein assembly factor BamE n=1 Tax=Neoroseomonas eburnea TaxID=1346889 RepID=A0A9X9XA24_9PROT|nr:outer membrane protein assembly factor BamE [Neoroseomonas eburnea]MBR0680560.1 outer membrane protein assembly factor BamE [Neoroseomonas eburnea]
MARHPRSVNARLAPLVLLALLGGCGWISDRLGPAPIERGNRVDPERLGQITPGVQSRNDVEALLGSPTARGTFDEDNWYYISARTRTQPGRYLEVEDRRVIAISFNREGVVSGIRELTEADGRNVSMVSRETPVPGNERTLLQALFGNIGRPGLDRGPAQNPASFAPRR